MKRTYLALHTMIAAFSLVAVYEIVRLNDEVSNLKHGEKWCNVSYQNRIETRPCTLSAELKTVNVSIK